MCKILCVILMIAKSGYINEEGPFSPVPRTQKQKMHQAAWVIIMQRNSASLKRHWNIRRQNTFSMNVACIVCSIRRLQNPLCTTSTRAICFSHRNHKQQSKLYVMLTVSAVEIWLHFFFIVGAHCSSLRFGCMYENWICVVTVFFSMRTFIYFIYQRMVSAKWVNCICGWVWIYSCIIFKH